MGNYRQQFYQLLVGIKEYDIKEPALKKIKTRHNELYERNKELCEKNVHSVIITSIMLGGTVLAVALHKYIIIYLWGFLWLLVAIYLFAVLYMVVNIFLVARKSLDFISLGNIHKEVGDSIIESIEKKGKKEENSDGND